LDDLYDNLCDKAAVYGLQGANNVLLVVIDFNELSYILPDGEIGLRNGGKGLNLVQFLVFNLL
jgi:hypothetical protein